MICVIVSSFSKNNRGKLAAVNDKYLFLSGKLDFKYEKYEACNPFLPTSSGRNL